ncbi:MAG: hypothetical protein D6771_06285, partial [Zetaproteobacteria bacterium]
MKRKREAADLKSEARKAILAKKYGKALELYQKVLRLDPDDLRTRVRIAELKEKLGDKEGAVRDYIEAANRYAEQGFVVQAIAINKIVLRIDPNRTEVKERLQELARERGDAWALTTISPMDKSGGGQAKVKLEKTPLLAGLSGKELEEFIDSLTLHHVPAGTYIYREGSPGDHLYLIGMGRIRLEVVDKEGARRVFSHLVEGDFFGERAFMARKPHDDAAIAETDAQILMIDRKTFDDWVRRHPHIQDVVEDFYRRRVLARILAISPMFAGIAPEARAEIAKKFRLKKFKTGEEIVREGEKGETFYVIRSGRVKVFTSDVRHPGKRIELKEMGEGD